MNLRNVTLFLTLSCKAFGVMPEGAAPEARRSAFAVLGTIAPKTQLLLGVATFVERIYGVGTILQDRHEYLKKAQSSNQIDLKSINQWYLKKIMEEIAKDESMAIQCFASGIDRIVSQEATEAPKNNDLKIWLEGAVMWGLQAYRAYSSCVSLCLELRAYWAIEYRDAHSRIPNASITITSLTWSLGNKIATAVLQYMTLRALKNPQAHKIPPRLKVGVTMSRIIGTTIGLISACIEAIKFKSYQQMPMKLYNFGSSLTQAYLLYQVVEAADRHIEAQQQKKTEI
jgi:hypothetical protein